MSDETLILDAVDKFLARDVAPVAHDLEQADAYPHEIVERMKTLGLFGATIGERYGGMGLNASGLREDRRARLRRLDVGLRHLQLAPHHVQRDRALRHRALKEAFLPRLARGELRGGIALTEPDCGTDLQAIRTRAVRDGDEYVVTGTKQWITNAVEGNVLAVLVKTDPDATPRHRGMSLLVVPKEAGYRATKLKKLGYRGVDTGEVEFADVRVPAANLIGEAEGRGLQQILSGLALGRINVAARGVGVAQASLDAALSYAQQRKTFGQPISQHQAIQIKLADMAVRVESARLLTERAAGIFDTGERCDLEAGMAKLAATEAAVENSMEAMRIHGAYGYSPDNDVERYYRDAPLLAIGEGTNEMQRIIIARQLVERSS